MGRRRGTSAFPVARIKKMMQSDDDVGKIATVTPVLVAKSLELMMQYVLEEAANIAVQRNTKTVTPQHLKTCVMNNDSFDFLRDVLKGVQPLEEDKKKRGKRPRSPAVDGKRVRRVRRERKEPVEQTPDDADQQQQQQQRVQQLATLPPLPPVEDHLAAVGRPKHDDEDDDYDDDDAPPAESPTDAAPDADPAPPVEQSQNGRMSVSALLS